jgi:hypothetical protein
MASERSGVIANCWRRSSLVMALLFVPLFKHRHDRGAAQRVVPTH